MKNNYTYFEVPYLSWFSTSLYKEAAFSWKGTGILYILVLTALIQALTTTLLWMNLNSFLATSLPVMVKDFPDFTIKNGKAAFKISQPHYIRDENTNIICVIDTTGRTQTIDDEHCKGTQCLITADKAIIKKSSVETRTFSFEKVEDFSLTGKDIVSWSKILGTLGIPVLYFFGIVFMFLFRICQMIFYSLIGKGISSVLGADISLKGLMRLSAVTVTPSILLTTALSLLDIEIPLLFLFSFAMTIAFLTRAIMNCKRKSQPIEDAGTFSAADIS